MSSQTPLRLEPCDDPPDLTDQLEQIHKLHVGRGAFGVVYKYRLRGESRQVAVKCFNDCPWGVDEATYRRRLRRELGIWKRLSHGNIVPLLGIAFVANPEFASPVSEWMPNGTLSEYVGRHETQLDAVRRLRLAGGVAAGLKYLHSCNIIHGDLSDTNILIDGNNEARLTDFGIANVPGNLCAEMAYLQTHAQQAGALMWTAPELLPGGSRHATVQSDMYSFGSIMLFTMTGSRPWPRNEVIWIPQKLKEGQTPPRPPSPSITDSVWEFIGTCWSHSPAQRPAARKALDFVSSAITDANDTSSRAVFEVLPISSEGSLTSVDTVPPPSTETNSNSQDADSLNPMKQDPPITSTDSPRQHSPPPKVLVSTAHLRYPESTDSSSDSSVRRNILIVGEIGVGKSSLVNLIAGKPVAATSDGARSCTLQYQHYNVDIGSVQLALHDTAGLRKTVGHTKTSDCLDIVYQAHSLISELESSGGISLLVYCMKAGQISVTMRQTYNLFVEVLCNYKVPVVIAVTHCESHDCMEDWWKENEKDIQNYGLFPVGHACVTAAPGYKNTFLDKYEQSRETMKELLLDYSQCASWKEDKANWLKRVGNWLPVHRANTLDRKDLQKKLIKRCGFSQEEATAIAWKIHETRPSKVAS